MKMHLTLSALRRSRLMTSFTWTEWFNTHISLPQALSSIEGEHALPKKIVVILACSIPTSRCRYLHIRSVD